MYYGNDVTDNKLGRCINVPLQYQRGRYLYILYERRPPPVNVKWQLELLIKAVFDKVPLSNVARLINFSSSIILFGYQYRHTLTLCIIYYIYFKTKYSWLPANIKSYKYWSRWKYQKLRIKFFFCKIHHQT